VQVRLAQPPDQQTTYPETGTCRALFDFPDLKLSSSGPRTRVIVAARAIPETPVKVGTIRGEHVYELFYTALPPGAFTPADVVTLYAALVARLRLCSRMKTRNKSWIAGALTPPGARSSG